MRYKYSCCYDPNLNYFRTLVTSPLWCGWGCWSVSMNSVFWSCFFLLWQMGPPEPPNTTTVHSPSSRSGPDTLQVDKLRRNYFILYILPSVPPTICRNTVKSNESCFGQKIQLVSVTVIETNNLFIKMSRACYLEQLAKYCMPIVKTETSEMSGVI